MLTRERLRTFFAWRPVRLTLFILGMLLMASTPFVAILPGPGGIFVFAAGLALALRNSDWAKRRYVRFKRWQPKAGAWADWGMRRGSHRRREALRKQREQDEAPSRAEIERMDDPLPSSGLELSPIDPTPTEVAPAHPAGGPHGR